MSSMCRATDLQYQGEAGALIAELASVDQDGSFVSPVPMTCNGQRLGEMAFWRTDGDWHSSLSLWNVAAEPMELEIRITHPGGEYEIVREIGPGATAMVSVNELQQSQEPDGEGRTIPAGVTMGGMSIRSRNQVNGLVMNAMLVNPVTKTCAECGSYGYVRYCVLTDDPGSTATHKSTIYRGVGENFPMYIVITYSTGFPEIVEAVIVGNTNPSVASGQTQVTTHSPGTTTLTGRTFYEYPLDRFCTVYDELETSGDLQVIQVTFQKADSSALPSPLRVGISTSAKDRKQPLRAVITPTTSTAPVLIIGSSKLQISNQNRNGNVITFDVVGTAPSMDPGDQTITALGGGGSVGSAAVSVVVPRKIATPHDTVGGGLVIQNMALNIKTSPALTDVPQTHKQLQTVYIRWLTITVKDQFGDLIGDVYENAEISEAEENSTMVFSINQHLTSMSTYIDPVGTSVGMTIVEATDTTAINNWINSTTRNPLPSGVPPLTQRMSVFVDNFRLQPDPAISNRTRTFSGSGTTSPPVNLTITWPN